MRFYRWRALRRAVLKSKSIAAADGPLREVVRRGRMLLSDLVAVEGRSGTLIILGSNFSEADLDEAIRTPSLADVLTGAYKARIGASGGRQFLEFELELRPGVTLDAEAAERVYRELVHSLGRVQPEFRNDWEKIYRSFDHDPAQRILRLEWHPWPELSRELEDRPKRSSIEALISSFHQPGPRAGANCRLLQSAISRRDLGITGPGPRSVTMHALPVAWRNRRLQTTKSAPAGLRGWGKTVRGDCGRGWQVGVSVGGAYVAFALPGE